MTRHVKKAPGGANADPNDIAATGQATVLLAAHGRRMDPQLVDALSSDGFELIARASDCAAAVREALDRQPDLCLLDSELPGGLAGAVAAIAASLPATRIGMLARSRDDVRALRAIDAGAEGILLLGNGAHGVRADAHLLLRGELPVPDTGIVEQLEPLLVPDQPKRSRTAAIVLYVPRFWRHLWRRLRSGMGLSVAWVSARDRMGDYR
jgi:DNA-binding NarL/FixJ family response regulator